MDTLRRIAMNAYELLGIQETATDREIRDAWRAKGFEWHPDRCALPGAGQQMARINAAAQTLLDPKKRMALDEELRVQRLVRDPELQRLLEKLRSVKRSAPPAPPVPKPKAGRWLEWASRYAQVSDMDGLSTVGYMFLGAFLDSKGVPGPPTDKKEQG